MNYSQAMEQFWRDCCQYLGMALFIVWGAGFPEKVSRYFFKADSSAITQVKKGIEDYRMECKKQKPLTYLSMFAIIAIGFGRKQQLAHFGSDLITAKSWNNINPL